MKDIGKNTLSYQIMVLYPQQVNDFFVDTPLKIGICLNVLSVIDIKIVIDMWLSSCLNSTLWIAAGMIIIHSF